MQTISMGPVISTDQSGIGEIGGGMFGAIAPNSFGWHAYADQTEQFGLNDVRFPGGTISETGYVVDGRIRWSGGEISLDTLDGDRSNFAFDLTHPELISPLALEYDDTHHLRRDDVATFSEALAHAVENGGSLSLIIPVKRYFKGVDFTDPEVREEAISAAVADIKVFLERLKTGEYNDGEYPEKITFDIGNELYKNPIAYAVIAKAMIDEIALQLADSEINYDIAIQMARGAADFHKLKSSGYFNEYFDGDFALVPGLENLDFDPTGPIPAEHLTTAVDQTMIAVLGESIVHIDALRHHYLGFDAQVLDRQDAPIHQRTDGLEVWYDALAAAGVSQEDVDYYVSAWSTVTAGGDDVPYHLSAAGNTLALFSYFAEIGVDRAAVWGVTGAFRYKDNIRTTTISDTRSKTDSPQGTILELMSENISGSTLVEVKESPTGGHVVYVYESEGTYTVFVVAGDFPDDELQIDVDLGLVGDLSTVNSVNLDIEGGAENGASRLTPSTLNVEGGAVTVTFDQDHEIAMLTLDGNESNRYATIQSIENLTGQTIFEEMEVTAQSGSTSSDTLNGQAGSDMIIGMAGDDILSGGAGRADVVFGGPDNFEFDAVGVNNGDFLLGGSGDDVIRGNAGNDLLAGGAGDDLLWGGGGFDTFVFDDGTDQIFDFTPGVDTLTINQTFVDADIDLALWLAQNSEVTDDGVRIVFNEEDSVMIHGVTDPEVLAGSVELHQNDLSFL